MRAIRKTCAQRTTEAYICPLCHKSVRGTGRSHPIINIEVSLQSTFARVQFAVNISERRKRGSAAWWVSRWLRHNDWHQQTYWLRSSRLSCQDKARDNQICVLCFVASFFCWCMLVETCLSIQYKPKEYFRQNFSVRSLIKVSLRCRTALSCKK